MPSGMQRLGRIEVEIRYTTSNTCGSRIRDDGRVIDRTVVDRDPAPQAIGACVACAERSKIVGGKFEGWSEHESGYRGRVDHTGRKLLCQNRPLRAGSVFSRIGWS